MKIYFIRHGQTDYNKQGRVQGREADMPLNEAGRAQVLVTRRLVPDHIDLIISSPMVRARHTADIINEKLQVPIALHEAVAEFMYGTLSGKNWDEIIAITGDPEAPRKDTTAAYNYQAWGGDSASDLQIRLARFLEEVKRDYSDKQILVSTHGGVIEAMQALQGKIVEPAQNARLYEFEI